MTNTPNCINCGRPMKQAATDAFNCRLCGLTELGSSRHQRPQQQQQQQQQGHNAVVSFAPLTPAPAATPAPASHTKYVCVISGSDDVECLAAPPRFWGLSACLAARYCSDLRLAYSTVRANQPALACGGACSGCAAGNGSHSNRKLASLNVLQSDDLGTDCNEGREQERSGERARLILLATDASVSCRPCFLSRSIENFRPSLADVRFTPISDRRADIAVGPL